MSSPTPERFQLRGTAALMFLPACANLAAPTTLEIAAGTDLIPNFAELAGFTYTNQPIVMEDWVSTFDTQIPGKDAAENSSLSFFDDKSGTNRTLLAKDTAGFVLRAPYGMTAGYRCEVWPITSAGPNQPWTAGNEAAKERIDVSVTSRPELDGVLP